MELNKLFPIDILTDPQNGIQELMRTFVVRTNFVPAVRQVIGWRGLKHCSASIDAWTAKIKDANGVYALYFDTVKERAGWIRGRYTLGYFPHPDEELVESLSVKGIAYTQRDNYFEMVRNFLLFPDFASLFNVAAVQLEVSRNQDALRLGLESVTRHRTIAKDGVVIPQGGCSVQLIAPGRYDQDFPSYEVAVGFFKILAASLSFCIQEPPAYLTHARFEGTKISYDSRGNYWETPCRQSDEVRVGLGYGNADFEPETTTGVLRELQVWKKPEEAIPFYQDALWWKAHNLLNRSSVDQRLLGVDERPQLIVVTGFLGAGKTTFLQHFIEYQVSRNRFVAVIQNEIGQTGLDGKLLDHDYALVEVDEGCVCCTLAGNLKRAIRQILADFCPDFIVLETTGLANPFNLLDDLTDLAEFVRFDSITTLVDAANVLTVLDNYEVSLTQVKGADILLVNKTDLLSKNDLEQVIPRLKEINPVAPIITAVQGDVNPSLVYGIGQDDVDNRGGGQIRKGTEATGVLHSSHTEDSLSSVKVEFDKPLRRERFLARIANLPKQIFRIKGIIEFREEKGPKLFQFVAGRYEISEYKNGGFGERFLICIGRDMGSTSFDAQALRVLFEERTV